MWNQTERIEIIILNVDLVKWIIISRVRLIGYVITWFYLFTWFFRFRHHRAFPICLFFFFISYLLFFNTSVRPLVRMFFKSCEINYTPSSRCRGRPKFDTDTHSWMTVQCSFKILGLRHPVANAAGSNIGVFKKFGTLIADVPVRSVRTLGNVIRVYSLELHVGKKHT